MNKEFFDKFSKGCPCGRHYGGDTYLDTKPGYLCDAMTTWGSGRYCQFEKCPMIFFFELMSRWEREKILFKRFQE